MSATRRLKMEVKSEKPLILVTGSSGLIGTSVVEAFASDFVVIGMDVKPPE
jgi:nucleoside-diphosphate-sugar epimerase